MAHFTSWRAPACKCLQTKWQVSSEDKSWIHWLLRLMMGVVWFFLTWCYRSLWTGEVNSCFSRPAVSLPLPTELSFSWIDQFTVNVSWKKPIGLPEGTEVQYMYSLSKHGSDNVGDGMKQVVTMQQQCHMWMTDHFFKHIAACWISVKPQGFMLFRYESKNLLLHKVALPLYCDVTLIKSTW